MATTSVLSQSLRDFVYFPVTVWREFFRPTFYFGCNVNDVDTEQAVLGDVGSYGSQLNRVLDALDVLTRLEGDRLAALPQEDRDAICSLQVLHRRASGASKRAEQRPRLF